MKIEPESVYINPKQRAYEIITPIGEKEIAYLVQKIALRKGKSAIFAHEIVFSVNTFTINFPPDATLF